MRNSFLLLGLVLTACEGAITGPAPTAALPDQEPPPLATAGQQLPPSDTSGPTTVEVPAPAGSPQGTQTVTRFVCNDHTYGSTSTARRLTTAEYSNAIFDVLGVSG